MNPFKKFKQLFASRADTPTDPKPSDTPAPVATSDVSTHSQVVTPILDWIEGRAWKYEYRPPNDDTPAHHIILGFTDNENDWTCVFRINDENSLVTMFGIIEDIVPASHYTAVLMTFAKINMNVSYGGLELDVGDGEVRAKLSFDGEFTNITERALNCYMQGMSGLTELARTIVQGLLVDKSPSQYASDYIETGDEVVVKDGDDKQVFFVPTHERQ